MPRRICFAGLLGWWRGPSPRESELMATQARELLNEPQAESRASRVLTGTSQRSGSLLVGLSAEHDRHSKDGVERRATRKPTPDKRGPSRSPSTQAGTPSPEPTGTP
jgi:hypothetical protein